MTRAQEILSRCDEVSPQRVMRIRQGRVQRKLVCEPGYVIKGTGCKKLSTREVRVFKKAAKKRNKKLRGKQHQIQLHRLKSLQKRGLLQ